MPPKKSKPARPKKNGRPRKDAPIEPPPAPIDDIDQGGLGRVEIRRAAAEAMTNGAGGGRTASQLVETFGIGERQAFRYVAAVREEWSQLEVEERPHQRAYLVRVQQGILVGAREDRDWTAANGGVRNLLELYGLKSTTKIEVGAGGMDALLEAIKTPPGQRDAEIAALEAEEREGAADGADPG